MEYRCVHSVSDAERVSTFDHGALLPPSAVKTATATSATELLVLAGHAGSGISLVAAHLARQLADARPAGSVLRHMTVDFTAYQGEVPLLDFVCARLGQAEVLHGSSTTSSSAGPTSAPAAHVMVSVTVSAEYHVSLPQLVGLLEFLLHAAATTVLTVVAPAALDAPAGDHCR